ncbi:MAG TPA: alpha/beta family hydrolase [Usitatibacter sp.]|nr:alpha/beta family hydrolase [Usitatibacter sp.]
MSAARAQPIEVALDDGGEVSGLALAPPDAIAAYVLAHGAGAGMAHPFMAAAAEGLARRRVATLRFQFPAMERGSKRVDSPKVAQGAVRSAVAEAARRWPELALFAGGKSFGGRMTSQAQAQSPLPGVRGLAFLGFPLHPAGRPADERGAHLAAVRIPMLFLQGSRDALASLDLLRPLVAKLGSRATLAVFADADHSFHVPARTGGRGSSALPGQAKDAEVLAQVLDTLVEWMKAQR